MEHRENLLISACLLGVTCRYDGRSKPLDRAQIAALMEKYNVVPVCPECLGGLPIPREPSERRGERIVMRSGRDVTENYLRGAEETLRLARLYGCTKALLKERSPSCGSDSIYDGSFSGTLVSGDGAASTLLKENAVSVFGESRISELL